MPAESRPDINCGPWNRVADFACAHPRMILFVTALLTVVAVWQAAQIELRADFAELLPQNDPAVVVLRETDRRIPVLSTVIIGVESTDPAANRRFVDTLVPALRSKKNPEVDSIEWNVSEEKAFFQRNKFLYAKESELTEALDRIEREVLKRKNPAFVDLLDEDDGKKENLSDQRTRIDQRENELFDRFPDGYFATKDQNIYAVAVRIRGSLLEGSAGRRVLKVVKETVKDLNPTSFHPEMTVTYTGNVVASLAEHDGLENDLIWASSVCVVLVLLAILLFFGNLWAIPLTTLPALCGVAVGIAFAQIAFGYLNASSAFMGSIIVGNGINFAFIQLARYQEERRRGANVRDSIAIALSTTWKATGVAALGAAIAYGSLAFTSFRGFSQFGAVNAVGMVCSWIVTLFSLPALWVLLDKGQISHSYFKFNGLKAIMGPIGRLAATNPKLMLLFSLALTVAAIIPLPQYLRDPFEYDFRKLKNQVSHNSPSERLSTKLNPVFGRTLSPNFVLADQPSEADEIRDKILEQDRRNQVIGSVKNINDMLPGNAAAQQRKLKTLGEIRKLIDSNINLLDAKERENVRALRPPDDLRVLTAWDLPLSMRRYFTEIDGTIGRPVVYLAKLTVSVWDGHTLLNIADVVQNVKLDSGKTIRSSGSAVIFAAMMRAIMHDGPIVTGLAFLGVALLIFAMTFRSGGGLLSIATLCMGVLWMIGAAATANVRVNFFNFIALPITFGIGVDYGINIYQRYQLEGPGNIPRAILATGSAVALCSLTTIIGYAALLTADNAALGSFGALAIIGEFSCSLAALVALPSILVLRERRVARKAELQTAPAMPSSSSITSGPAESSS